MRSIPLQSTSFYLLAALSMAGAPSLRAASLEEISKNVATENNLAEFELLAPDLSAEEKFDVEQTLKAENSGEFEALGEQLLPESGAANKTLTGTSSSLVIEIFQASKKVGKQFLIARQNGRIRYVFAVSAAAAGHSTPAGQFGVLANGNTSSGQLFRHMSGTYPSRGENNMDHLTYFRPTVGFHSTVFGLYYKLGTRDSHGCVRMARPEARAIFRLVRAFGASATIISRTSGEPLDSELPLIQKQLAKDLNFIQLLITKLGRADVPFKEAKEYDDYMGGRMGRDEVQRRLASYKPSVGNSIVDLPRDQDLGQSNTPDSTTTFSPNGLAKKEGGFWKRH